MSVPWIAHVKVSAFDALVPPALLRRVLAGLAGLTADVTFRVISAVTLFACHRVAYIAMAVAFTTIKKRVAYRIIHKD